jgi:hypothetical protein
MTIGGHWMSRNRVFVISPIGEAEADVRGESEDVMNKLINPALALIEE